MKWLNIVQKLIPIVTGAIHAVKVLTAKRDNEVRTPEENTAYNKERQDAAVNAIEAMIPAFQLVLPEGAFQSDEFQKLLREFIDDYVAIQNFIAKFKTPE